MAAHYWQMNEILCQMDFRSNITGMHRPPVLTSLFEVARKYLGCGRARGVTEHVDDDCNT